MSKKSKQPAAASWASLRPQYSASMSLPGAVLKQPSTVSSPRERSESSDWKQELVVAISERRRAEEKVRFQAREIDELQTTISVLLRRKREDEMLLEDSLVVNLAELVWPFLERLRRTRLSKLQSKYLRNIEINIGDIISPLAGRITARTRALTPVELTVAKYVRLGMSSTEISDLLSLSEGAVVRHRAVILHKIGGNECRCDLKELLTSLDPRPVAAMSDGLVEEKG